MNDDTTNPGSDEPTQPQFPLVPAPLMERFRPYLRQARETVVRIWKSASERVSTFLSRLSPGQRAVTIGASAVLGVCLACSFCVAGIMALPNVPAAPTSAPRGNSGNAPKIVQTAAPKATNTAGPTATPAATSTPKATPTATKPPSPSVQLTALLKSALQKDGRPTDGLKVDFEIGDEVVDVQVKAHDNLTGDFIKIGIQEDALTIMRTLTTQWPASLGARPQITFKAMGSTTDKYGNESTGAWGTAVLYPETGAKFNWKNLDYRTAWDAYDVKYWISGL